MCMPHMRTDPYKLTLRTRPIAILTHTRSPHQYTPTRTHPTPQVHGATLKGTGERVVVKVLKPGVTDTLTADLALFTSVAKVRE